MLLERRGSNCVPAVQVELPALKVPETFTEASNPCATLEAIDWFLTYDLL